MAEREDASPVMDERIRVIRRASWVGIAGNGFLSALKIVSGFLFYSYALIGDGLDSLTDVITSLVTLVTARIASRPPDLEHPYGHGRAETIATKLLSFIIFFAGAQLAFSSIQRLFKPAEVQLPETPAFIVIGISIVGKILLAGYKYRAGKRVGSSMLIADAKNMRNDVLISGSVLVGLLFTVILGKPILDSITALIVSGWILKTALGIFLETSTELMDGVDDQSIYQRVFDAVRTVSGVENPHKTRIRKLNNVYIVDMDIEVDGSKSVEQGHRIAMAVEQRIRKTVADIYDVNVHVEPIGNIEKRELFGLCEESLKKE